MRITLRSSGIERFLDGAVAGLEKQMFGGFQWMWLRGIVDEPSTLPSCVPLLRLVEKGSVDAHLVSA